jgi:hypothetical protein
LRLVIEEQPTVLILDHVVAATTALKGYVRSLRGNQLGVVFAVDAEHSRDHTAARAFHLAYQEVKLAPLGRKHMKRLLAAKLRHPKLPFPLLEEDAAALLDIAAGRPGWVEMIVERLVHRGYWRDGRVLTEILRAEAASVVAARYMLANSNKRIN